MKNEPDFTRKLINSFEKAAEQKVISKGQFLIKEGEEEKNLYFVTSGAIRVFYLSEFEEQTIRFGDSHSRCRETQQCIHFGPLPDNLLLIPSEFGSFFHLSIKIQCAIRFFVF